MPLFVIFIVYWDICSLNSPRIGAVGSQEHPSKKHSCKWLRKKHISKTNSKSPWKSIVGEDEMSFWNGPFFWGDMWFSFVGGGEKNIAPLRGSPIATSDFCPPTKSPCHRQTASVGVYVDAGVRELRDSGTSQHSSTWVGLNRCCFFWQGRVKKTTTKNSRPKKSLKKWDICKKIWICTFFHCKSSNQIFSFQLWS